VFQQYSLYPTMSVYDNLAFPLRSPMRQFDSEAIERRVLDTARLLHIDHLLQRKTANLSGGEMQRVSLGRALVRQPRIYLMDEPLSNLDAKLREELRVELKHIQNTAGSTILFVTHDQTEALTMADRIGVLHAGHIVQIGTPDDIYDRPATTFVARMVGTPRINLVEAEREDGTLNVVGSTVRLPLPKTDDDGLPRSLLLGVRPEDVRPDPAGPFDGRLVLTEPLGLETILHIEAGEKTILSTVPGMTRLSVGENVRFNVNQAHLHYFDPDGDRIPASRVSA
jgi:multiple sugar transport system ATP-binding protein